jgi:hypothetical protein
MDIHKTLTVWAKATDSNFEVSHTFIDPCLYRELNLCSRATLMVEDPIMQKKFLLDIFVPHERRSATYSMGPDFDDGINDAIEFFLPDFSSEEQFRLALEVVHKRFLTEYGSQRFADPAPDRAPDIFDTATKWADWKDCGISVEKNEDNSGVLVFIPDSGVASIGSELEILHERSISQNLLETTSGTLNAVPGYLPPFFTASELRGALEAAFAVHKHA